MQNSKRAFHQVMWPLALSLSMKSIYRPADCEFDFAVDGSYQFEYKCEKNDSKEKPPNYLIG